ncbi:MAG: hypothetical protein GQ580_00530 [Candidatus Thorarchaeota archaeon]|nr:hypothetical protein [Candidatus Thorarchaeota archaeon]
MIDEKTKAALRSLGLVAGSSVDSRTLNLLGAVLRIQEDPPAPMQFKRIYESMMADNPGSSLTKAWVQRVLKSLVIDRLIRVESEHAYRKMYLADVSTVMAGLEKIKSETIQKLNSQKSVLAQQLDFMTSMDCGLLAENLVEGLTGDRQKLSSRFIKGMDEYYRVTNTTIYEPAKEGDIIRCSIVTFAPYVKGAMERVDRIFVVAARGVEVRYLVTIEALKHDSSIRSEIAPDRLAMTIASFIHSLNEGLPIDIRFNDGPQNTYQFMSINNDSLAFMISENPLTAAWITRVFNPDLIDNAIASFDLQWEEAVSLSKLSPEYLKNAEIPPNACIVEALADVYRTMGEEPH